MNLLAQFSATANKLYLQKHFFMFLRLYKYVGCWMMSCFLYYLAFSNVTVTWFTLHVSSCLLEEESVSGGFFDLPTENPGLLGSGISAVSLPSIKSTEGIVGLSSARSWTHNSPTCMHLRTSDGVYDSPIDESTSSNAVPSLHCVHAYNKKNINSFLVLKI
jgi:hypothetical protein